LPERGERGQHCEVYYVAGRAAMHIVKTMQDVGLRLAWYALVAAALGGCFPQQAGPRLQHFDWSAPQVGAPAPLFELQAIDGTRVRLQDLLGDKPTVLQLGSHSCPVYRYRRFGMAALHEKYKDRVNFLIVYTLEAHPAGAKSPYADGEWLTWWNRFGGVRIPQSASSEARRAQARLSHEVLRIAYPMAADGMDNRVWKAYGAASSPAFVIDRNGHVALRQVWLDPTGIAQALDRLLTDQ
jgi:peroxiredoxin